MGQCSSRKQTYFSDDSDSSEQLHPLKINPILKEVFRNLDFQSLKKCRLVCSEWNDIVLPFFSARACVSLPHLNERKTIADFVSLMRKSENLPFRKYNLDIWEIKLNDPDLLNFWSLCGPFVQEIMTFDVFPFAGVSPQLSDFKYIFERLPNLQVLNLYNMPINLFMTDPYSLPLNDLDFSDNIELPILRNLRKVRLPYLMIDKEVEEQQLSLCQIHGFWIKIFSSAINLQEIIAYCYSMPSTFLQAFFDSLTISMTASNISLRNITCLRFGALTQVDCERLNELVIISGWQLNEFEVWEFSEGVQINSLKPFFEQVKGHLKTLKFGYSEDEGYILSKFPRMERLVEAKFTLYGKTQPETQSFCVQSIVFSKDFPNLKRLHIQGKIANASERIFEWGDIFRDPGNFQAPCNSLDKLTFNWDSVGSSYFSRNRFVTNDRLITDLDLIFPSLKSLKIWPLDVNAMKVLLTSFKQLSVLELGFCPNSKFNDAHSNRNYMHIIPDHDFRDIDELKQLVWVGHNIFLGEVSETISSGRIVRKLVEPSIRNFKYLQFLRFMYKGFGYSQPARFDDQYGSLVFSNLSPTIRGLEFGAETKMSKECLENIRMTLPDMYIQIK